MDYKDKSKEELILELENLRSEYHDLKKLYVSSVSDLKKTEDILSESETKFRKIFENGPLGMAIVDRNFRFLMVNTTFSKILGYSEAELYNLKFVDVTHPYDVYNDTQNVQKLILGESSVYKTEKRYIRKDGQEIWVTVTVSAIFNDKRKFLYYLALIEEISTRKKVEDVLNRVTERLELATRSAHMGIWDWQINSNQVLGNNQMYKLYGICKGDIGETTEEWINMLYPNDVKLVKECMQQSLQGHDEFNVEFRIVWPDKSVRWLKSVGQVCFDGKSTPVRVIGVSYDITNQKNSIYSLIESEVILRASLDSMDEVVFITDTQGCIIEYNEAFCEFFNINCKIQHSKGIIAPTDFIDAFTLSGELIPVSEWAISRALNGEIVKNNDYILKRKDTGVSYYSSISFAPIYDHDNLIVGAVVSARDTTEQKQVEKALIKSRDLLLNLARLVPGVIYQYRLYPDGSSSFPYSSPGMFDIYEVSPEEVKDDASPVFTRLHPDDYDVIVKKINHSAETLEIFFCEFRVILPNKGLQWRWSQAHPERMEDGGTLWHGIISDITERKEAEILLRQKSDEIEAQNIEYQRLNEELRNTNEKLKEAKEIAEQSDKLKTVFLQNMSHEIRTPMNAIMGFAELISQYLEDKEKLKKYVKIINQRCNDLLDIITEILDFAKIESGQLPVTLVDCKINLVFFDLQEFFSEYQYRQAKQHIQLEFKPLSTSKEVIRTDAVKLKQILINLIANAFKFTDQGSIKVGCSIENGELLFHVIDTGFGIPADKREYIFERFAQLEPHPGHVYGGTGLGLSIVKGLLNMLGGKIWFTSEIGKGTAFYFTLPLIQSNTALIKKYAKKPNSYLFIDKTILIVEDDDFNAEFLKDSLVQTGAKLLHTIYGKEAVHIASTQKVDVILMDIRLPDIDGYQASKLIKETNPEIIIIAQTSYAANEYREKALKAGCNDYISKPARLESLLATIKKYL